MNKFATLLLACVLLALGACAGLTRLQEKPQVSLAGLDLAELGLFEQRFVLQLRVQNPNEVELPIRGLSFDVELHGQPFAKGLSDKAVRVPAFGEALLEVKATSNLASVLRQLRELQKSGREQTDYRIFGTIAVEGLGRLPFDRSGDVRLPNLGLSRKPAPPRGI